MTVRLFSVLATALALGACAASQTENRFTGERTVFDNPYVAPELDQRAIGPGSQGNELIGKDRWIDGLLYPGAGDIAYDREGNRVRLSRSDRRELRERYLALQAQAEQNELVAEFNARQADLPPPPEAKPDVEQTAPR